MPTITINVDLEDFGDDELIQELKSRGIESRFAPSKVDTLEKQMKYDFFMENIENIPLDRLEASVYEPYKYR